jgi:hypothetical protein
MVLCRRMGFESRRGKGLVTARVTVGSIEHNSLFIRYQLNNMFRPNGPSGWQEWKINTKF